MKKTIKKISQKATFLSQLESTPKQIKMFFVGLLVLVAALAFVLPNINGKMLQGSVTNIGNKSGYGYGYGYGYGTTTTSYGYGFCTMVCKPIQTTQNYSDLALQNGYGYGYDGYGYGLNGNNGYFSFDIKNVGNVAINPDLQRLNHSLYIDGNNGYTTQYVLEGDFMSNLYSKFSINPGQTYTIKGSIRLLTGKFDKGSYLRFNLPYPEQTIGNNSIDVYLNQKPTGNTTNICQSPENVLACSLGLNSCPAECGYNGTGTTQTGVDCNSAMNVLACALGLDSCPVECTAASIGFSSTTNTDTITVNPGSKKVIMAGVLETNKPVKINHVSLNLDNNSSTNSIKDIVFQIREDGGDWITADHTRVFNQSKATFSRTFIVKNRTYIQFVVEYKPDAIANSTLKFKDMQLGDLYAYDYSTMVRVEKSSGTISSETHKIAESIISTGPIIPTPNYTYLTKWLDRDNPSGAGDYEAYKDFAPIPCGNDKVVAMKYKTVNGESYSNLKLIVRDFDVICENKNNNNACVDFAVQYECEKQAQK